jgi:hypothetical protein
MWFAAAAEPAGGYRRIISRRSDVIDQLDLSAMDVVLLA